MKKQIITTTTLLGLTALFSSTPTSATEQIASQLGVSSCTGCHSSQNGSKGNLIAGVKNAYNQDKRGLSGLKTFLSTSATPTCTNGQVLNTAKTACVTPTPVTPTCTNGQILNTAKTACVTPATTTSKTNTKPVLNEVNKQWDAKVGEAFVIPLSVEDAEQDEFMMLGSTAGSTFSKVYADEKILLPTIDFQWTPKATDANKVYTISFQAKETKTTQKLVSNKVSVKIRVWTAGNPENASISKLNVSTSAWKNGYLNLSGVVVFSNLLTTAERQSFISKPFDLTVSNTSGAVIETVPLTLDLKGNWSVSVPMLSVPCDVVLDYEGQKAARTITGSCMKTVATLAETATIVAANQFYDDDDDDENEHSKNNSNHHDD